MAVFLGLAVAATYGAGDFFGGLATKRTTTWAVVVVVQVVGLVALLGLVPLDGAPFPASRDLWLGAVASLAGTAGVGFLYLGLARGPMGVVAPITAVGAALLPVTWGLLQGERPSAVALAGVVLALVAVVFIARHPPGHGPDEPDAAATSTLVTAVASGACFGTFFIVISHTDDGSGFWPLLSGRAASIPLLVIVLALARQPLVPARASLGSAALAGFLDVAANSLLILAVREGLLALVSPVASLYPATTVLLARVVLDERLHRLQIGGLVAALVGVLLIAGG
ncbi:MAG: EamA family transporter [Acidimicrobiia bacterium]